MGGVTWSAGGRGEAFYSSPAVVANRVYAVGSQGQQGRIHAFDLETGRQLWSCRPPGYAATFSSPVVVGELLVCGEGLHHTRMARVVCLNVTTGQIAWTFPTNGHVECTPAVDQGRVYVTAGDDGVYCLRLDPDASLDRRLVWHAPGTRYPDAETSLAVADGKVYVGLGLGGEALCCLDADTGEELGRLAMPHPVFSPPSIHNGKLYLGMGVGDYLTPLQDPAGEVRCVDLKTWQVDWTFATKATVLGAVVAADEQLVFGCADGRVYVISLAGKLQHSWDSHAPIIGSPAVTADRVYVVNQDGILLGLDRRRLEPVWQCRLGNPGRYISSPVVAEDSVLVGTEHNRLSRLGRSPPSHGERSWPGFLGGAGAGGNVDNSMLPVRGVIRWQFPGAPTEASSDFKMTGPAAVYGDSVLIPISGEQTTGLACLDPNASPSTVPVMKWFFHTAQGVSSSPAITGDRALVVDGAVGDQQRQLHVVDLVSGQLLWRCPVAADSSGALTADHDGILLQSGRATVDCMDRDGAVRWSQTLGQVEHAFAATSALVVIAVFMPPSLVTLDRPTGRVLWRVPLKNTPRASPVLSNRNILLGTDQGVEWRRLVDGQLLACSPSECGGVAGPVAADEERCYFVSDTAHLVVARLADARVLAMVPEVSLRVPPVVASNGLLVSGMERLLFVRSDQWLPALSPWAVGATSRATSPAVLHDGHVYVAIQGRGLVCFEGGVP